MVDEGPGVTKGVAVVVVVAVVVSTGAAVYWYSSPGAEVSGADVSAWAVDEGQPYMLSDGGKFGLMT